MEFPGNPPLSTPAGPTSDEKTMAALSHFFGWLVALIVYFTQREKSRFVRFQALQAIAFDVFVMLITFVFVMIVMVLFFVIMALVGLGVWTSTANSTDPTGSTGFILLMTILPMLPFFLIFPLAIAIMVLRIVAGIQTAQGKDYRYPVIGKLVEKWAA